LAVDVAERTLDVQGAATYEDVVDFTLPNGLLPTITPELKHITVGGAIVGIGIESNSYRYGFVHDALLEADVLLADGRVVRCSPGNDHADLFRALPNSYGTLGYVLRATMRLRPATSYVTLRTERFTDVGAFVDALAAATDDPGVDYLESLAYAKDRVYLTAGRDTDAADGPVTSIYGSTVFYREISRPGEVTLTTKDYLFRYDPEWFWALADGRAVDLFRRYAPPSIRQSGFYTRFSAWRKKVVPQRADAPTELLIQDWEVPWPHARELLEFVLDTVDLDGKPLMAAPVRVPAPATLYPMTPGQLHLNVGSYNFIRRKPGQERYAATRAIDGFCFANGGIKMLYSTTFLDEDDFARRYGGEEYDRLKKAYDPHGLLPTLYEKAVRAR
jgi:FAD/FMN-containing dehydrogenase